MHAGAAYQYMLTAAHCMSWLDDTSVYNGQGASMGYSDYVAELAGAGYDLALIRITGDASVAPRIYHTGPTDPGFTSRTVVAASNGILLDGFGSLNITAAGIVKGGVTDPNNPQCSKSGYISVIRTALNLIPGLQIKL